MKGVPPSSRAGGIGAGAGTVAGTQHLQALGRRTSPAPPLRNSSSSAAACAAASAASASGAVRPSGSTPPPPVELTGSMGPPGSMHHGSHHPHTDDDDLHLTLSSFSLSVPGVSLEPLSANGVLECVGSKTDEVVTRYLPCVDFLVACQQELRAGLAAATKKKVCRGRPRRCVDSMTPRQFFNQYLHPLPDRFYQQNKHLMPQSDLREAYKGVQSLTGDAKRAEVHGCEAVKNAFLGGMRDGESWGLRRWLSKNGGALRICNDLELVLGALQKLPREDQATKRVAELVRPRAKQAHDRLKADVPEAYQAHSTAHPYLPFFHRLEEVLRRMSSFDPEDDDVICIDDEEDEEEIEEVKSSSAIAAASSSSSSAKPQPPTKNEDDNPSAGTKRKLSCDDADMDGHPTKMFKEEAFKEEGSAGGDTEDLFNTLAANVARRGTSSSNEAEDSDIEILCVTGDGNGSGNDRDCGESSAQAAFSPPPPGGGADADADPGPSTTPLDVLTGLRELSGYPGPGNNNSGSGNANNSGRGANGGRGEEDSDRMSPTPLHPDHQIRQHQHQHQQYGHGHDQRKRQLKTQSQSQQQPRTDWRCPRCTFLNTATTRRCAMCDDEDDNSSAGGTTGGTNTADETDSRISRGEFTRASLDADARLGGLLEEAAAANAWDAGAAASATAQQQQQQQQMQPPQAPQMQQHQQLQHQQQYRAAHQSQHNQAQSQAQPQSHKVHPFAPKDPADLAADADRIARRFDTLADAFEDGTSSRLGLDDLVDPSAFWNQPRRYAAVLRHLAGLLRTDDARDPRTCVVVRPDDAAMFLAGRPPFASVVRHPVSFRDIHDALAPQGEGGGGAAAGGGGAGAGKLPPDVGLRKWCMWDGRDLLHAADLVLVDRLAYAGKNRQEERYPVLTMRKALWDFVAENANYEREVMPTKRGETSGFVVHKKKGGGGGGSGGGR